MDFKTLESAAYDEGSRQFWQHKRVKVVGQYAPFRGSDRVFSLVRFRIQCCAADAIQLNVPMICAESLSGFQANQWVEVIGRVEFQRRPDSSFTTIVVIPRRQNVNLTNPDPECDLDYVPNVSRAVRVEVALCNCIAFGSKNSALVVKGQTIV